MEKKRTYIILIGVIIAVLLFTVGYIWGMKKIASNQKAKAELEKSITLESDIKETLAEDKILSEDINIIFKTRNKEDGSEQIEREYKVGDYYKGKKLNELEDYFKKEGYVLEKNELKNKKLVFVKQIQKMDSYSYSKDKYILGIYDGKLAIYKVDDEGEWVIENPKTDITDIDVNSNSFPAYERQRIEAGDKAYQFDTKEEAMGENGLGAYSEFKKSKK